MTGSSRNVSLCYVHNEPNKNSISCNYLELCVVCYTLHFNQTSSVITNMPDRHK